MGRSAQVQSAHATPNLAVPTNHARNGPFISASLAELVGRAEDALVAAPGVSGVRRVRMRWIGHEIQADADLEVDPQTSLADAHGIAHRAEKVLVGAVPKLSSAVVHAYPAPDTQHCAQPRPAG